MTTYLTTYCLVSTGRELRPGDTVPMHDLDLATEVLSTLEDGDDLYVELNPRGDRFVFRGDGSQIFVEVDTRRGGFWNKTVSLREAQGLLSELEACATHPELFGFQESEFQM